MVAIPIAWIIVVSVTEILTPSHIHLGPLLVAAPAVTPSFAGPRTVGLVATLAVIAQTVIGVLRDPDELLSANREAQILALIVVGICLVLFCVERERRAKEMEQVRYVSEAAQQVVLPPLPKRLGPLRTAVMYLAAEAEARIGGDLYAAARTTSGTRVIVGDVRGKGMTAVSDAALLLGAFRVAAHRHAPLEELVAYLDRSVRWDVVEPEGDESLSAGGVLARHAAAGARTAVVTATWAPDTLRAAELAEALRILGAGKPRLLGYADARVPQSAPGCPRFCDAPLDEAVQRLVAHP
jgi:hypothetical protein